MDDEYRERRGGAHDGTGERFRERETGDDGGDRAPARGGSRDDCDDDDDDDGDDGGPARDGGRVANLRLGVREQQGSEGQGTHGAGTTQAGPSDGAQMADGGAQM